MKSPKFRSPELAEKCKQSLDIFSKIELEIVLKDSDWILQVKNIVIEPAKSATTPPALSIYPILDTDTVLFARKLQRMQRHPSRAIVNLGSACIRKVICGSERQYYLETIADSVSSKVRFYPQFLSLNKSPAEFLF